MDKIVGAEPAGIRNLVLRGLAPSDRRALEPHFQFMSLASGDILYEPDYVVDWVYFPNTAVLSW